MNNEQIKESLEKYQQGDIEAFQEVYDELKVPIYTIIYRILYDHMKAEDVMQEIFIKMYDKSPFLQVENPRAFIFQMARNLAIDELRKTKETNPLTYDMDSKEVSIDDTISRKLDVEQAIKQLAIDEREIVTLRLNGDLKFREIANVNNKPIGTVLWKYQEAIKKLRKLLSGGGD